MACNPPFRLDEITIVGGDYQELLFRVRNGEAGDLMELDDIQMIFSLIDYKNRYGTPIISRECEVSASDSKAFQVVLNAEDTKNLADKYIYQVTVKSPNNKQKSFQGVMTIDKNIDPDG